jgi:nucleoside-diphosphate-sugar epimerase
MDIPLDFIKTNVIGSQNIINAAAKVEEIEQFIIISTRSAVGQTKSADSLMTEDQPMRPINPYGATKLAMEGLFHSYHSDTNVSVKICRMQPIYGPRGRHDMFVWRIFNSIITGDQIQKYGDGQGVRDWLYISDAVDAVFNLLNTEISFGVFNIGAGEMTSTNDLIELCEQIAAKKANMINIPAIRGDAVFAGIADCTKIYKICGWKAKIKIIEGLKKTYKYMKK